MRALLRLLVGAFLLLTVAPAWAASDRRIALVIGNSAYRKFPQLPNPRNDAEDVMAAMKRVGFTVLGGLDMTREQMRDSLRQFARAAQDSEAAMVFYAGHGLQYRGRNYLVPVDAKLEDEFDLEYETVRVDDVVEELNRADGPRILMLDACRNLPLAARSRDPFSSTGLAKLSGRGLIVAYATQANQVAYDGTGRNSIFTGAFIKTVQEPGLDVAQVFQRVSMNVDRATGGRQTPELSLSYPGQFYLNKGETEREAWPRARASNDPQQLRDFIARFPESFLVEDARDMLRRLESRGTAQAQAPAQAERSVPAPAQNDRAPAPTLQLARRPDDAAAARSREEAERLAWQRLQDEQKRRGEARQQAEQERAAEEARQRKLAEERSAAEARERQRLEREAKLEEDRRQAETRKAEQERVVEEARQRKLAEDRAASEARERQRVEREAKLEEERRRLEARKAEQERVAEEARQRKLAEDRSAAEARERQRVEREAKLDEERRLAETRKAEQDRAAEEARLRKVAEERSTAEARERQRLEREAKLEEERRQAELRKVEQERVASEARDRQRLALEARLEDERRATETRKAEQERVAEEARLRKLAEDRAAAEVRERQRVEREARAEEERRVADLRRVEQERFGEEARQRKLVEERAAAEAKERQRLALESAKREDERVRLAAADQAERDRAAWQQLEELQRRRSSPAQAELSAPAASARIESNLASGNTQTTLDALKSGRSGAPSNALATIAEGARSEQPPAPMRLASNDATQPAITTPASPTAFPKEVLDQDRLVRETKAELGRIGCYDEEADGKWDGEARDALRRFGRQAKLSPIPSDPSPELLQDLKGRPAQTCPLECGAGERAQGDQCVAVARPEQQPAKKREPKPRAVAQERRAPAAPEPRVVRPRPQPAPAQAPVSTAAAPRPSAPRPMMGIGF